MLSGVIAGASCVSQQRGSKHQTILATMFWKIEKAHPGVLGFVSLNELFLAQDAAV